ncbi:MAG: hypothetical protein ACE5D3_01570 [Candidatus Binatia bacterium]
MTITTSPKRRRLADDVADPFPPKKSVLIDVTDLAGIDGEMLRVELRRTRDPAARGGSVPPADKLVDKSNVVGLIKETDVPAEGRPFQLAYHNWNGLIDFGTLSTGEPVRDVVYDDGCYYFVTNEGQWRLKVLDAGN